MKSMKEEGEMESTAVKKSSNDTGNEAKQGTTVGMIYRWVRSVCPNIVGIYLNFVLDI